MAATTRETRRFDTEVDELLHLMIHSLYSNKEIFLRELISNASDAVDKLRFEASQHPDWWEDDPTPKIWVDIDPIARTLTVRDNGIGMSREEVITHLGTIAKSGTRSFLTRLTGDAAKDHQLIGQFGVGFYASFMVADRVEVRSRRAGLSSHEGVYWTSTGTGEYEVETCERAERGTEVVLHLKADEAEFLANSRLRHIITKYSDHIRFPIVMKSEPMPTFGEDAQAEAPVEEATEEVVNQATALWAMPKADITEEQYQALYKHIALDYDNPLAWTHQNVEGKYQYTVLLYLPKHAPFDIWNPDRARGLKLYVRRVFIMDDAAQFLPNYLRFMRGVIDSQDLPLNVSREILQNNRIVEAMRNTVAKRTLALLADLAKDKPEDYAMFWKEFGQLLKEGVVEDYTNRDTIASLLRFSSTHTDQPAQTVSLADYVQRMPEGQTKIYYIAAENFSAAKHSPQLEVFRARGVEVLLLSDRIDEWFLSHFTEFEGKPFQSIAKGELDDLSFAPEAAKSATVTEADTAAFESVLAQVKEVLGDRVKSVRLTERLTSSPACIVADTHDMTRQMAQIMRHAGHGTAQYTPVFELNPHHLLVQRLQKETDATEFANLSQLLFDQALLAEGGHLEDPAAFVQRLNDLLLRVSIQK